MPSPAAASEPLGDLNATGLRLAVDGDGVALLTYRREGGELRRLLAWGAVDAVAPSTGLPQVRFRLDYGGGWGTWRRAVWQTHRNVCRPYSGPPLPFLVTACTAPDGSHWAVQSWQRLLPMRGFDPWTPRQAGFELHLSHWTGVLPLLQVSPNWTYGGQWQALFGRLTWRGEPIPAVPQLGAVLDCLSLTNEPQIGGRYAVREAEMVARHLRPERSTGFVVHDEAAASQPPELGRRTEAGRATAHDEAVDGPCG